MHEPQRPGLPGQGICRLLHIWRCVTLQGLFRGAHVYHEVAAKLTQSLPEVQNRLQEKLRSVGPGLWVAPGRRNELARVKAIQRDHLHNSLR